MIERLVSLIAPHNCIVCSEEGDLVCAWCVPHVIDTVPSRCYRCYAVSQDSAVCDRCRKQSPLTHVWVRAVYDGNARTLIHKLKFERAKAAAARIAGLLDDTLPYLPSTTVVSYVPTARRRVRIRGFDQTKLIAQSFARRRGLSCQTLLVRHGHSRQLGATKAARTTQAAQDYTLKHKQLTTPMVLLIDDILTTGATIEATAKLLKQAGVKQVNAAVFAQKQ